MKKVFAIIMSAMMLVCFMPAMAFAGGETPAKNWESDGKFMVGLQSGATTATAEVYDDYSVLAKVSGNTVDAAALTVSAKMKNVESLEVTGERSYSKTFKTGLTQGSAIPLPQWFPHIFGDDKVKPFSGATITGQVDGNNFGYTVSGFTKTSETPEYELTAKPTDTEKVRTAWHALTANVSTDVIGDNSKIEIPEGAYLQVGKEKLEFKSKCLVDPSSQNNGAGTVQAIKDAAELNTKAENAKENVELYVPKDSVIQLSSSLAKLNRGIYIRSDIQLPENTLANLRTAANTGLAETVVSLINVVDGTVALADGKTIKVDVLSAYSVTVDDTKTMYAYNDTFTLPAADSGKKWVDAKNNTVKAGIITVRSDMELKQVKDAAGGSTGGGGGGFVPMVPTETPLDKAKAEANTAVKAAGSANKYDEAEQAEVKKILDKAEADIKAAKTEDEVKKIQEAAQAEIEKILTSEENAQIKALSGVDKDIFKAKSKYSKLRGKRAVKVTWNVPKGMKLDGYEVFRSTKRYSGFGTKPYFTTSKTSYVNNKGLVKGKTYYYKVRGFVEINGERYYTGFSTKAFRIIK